MSWAEERREAAAAHAAALEQRKAGETAKARELLVGFVAELKARGPFTKFGKHGQSGQEISELFPHMAGIADDLCIIRSMQTEQINHDPAHAFMNSGSIIKGRPSMGSWLLYGLGAETEDLPGFKGPRVTCAECGEGINFKREVIRDNRAVCRACAGERYYT